MYLSIFFIQAGKLQPKNELRIQSCESGVKVGERRMRDTGYGMLDTGCKILDAGYWILDAGCWMWILEY